MSCSRFAAFISLNLDIAKGKHPHSSSPRRGRLRRQEFQRDIFGLREYLAMKRVRREIRDLSTLEWQEIVNAFWVMKTTSDSDGKKFFGAKFISYDSMVAKHIAAALDPRGDQAHFGPVLGLFHRAWLLELENSIRAIDSRIEALPYWDFARDVAPLNSNYTSIFSDKYFGSYSGQSPDHAVVDGRFAYWKISRDNSSVTNSYGYMRHPLSMNKSPYVTRAGGAICGYQIGLGDPTMWNMCLNVGESISDWTACVDSNIHGPAHSSIAGSWRKEGQTSDSSYCAQWYGFIAPPQKAKLVQTNTNFRYPYGTFINPYALDCFECPTCDLSIDPSKCTCAPKDPNFQCGPLWTNLVGNISGSMNLRGGGNATDNMVTLSDPSVIQILGDVGDPAASPNDPIFWAHHANIDRHFETWMNMNPSVTLRQNYFHFPLDGFAPGCNLDDVINSRAPFTNLSSSDQGFPYTVKDVFDRLTGDNTPYTYDSIVIAQTQRRPLNAFDAFSTESSSSKSFDKRGLKGLKGSQDQIDLKSPERNPTTALYTMDRQSLRTGSKRNEGAALGGLVRGMFVPERKYSAGLGSITPYILVSFVFLMGVVSFRYVVHRLILAQSEGKRDQGQLKVAITREMRVEAVGHNVVSPMPSNDQGNGPDNDNGSTYHTAEYHARNGVLSNESSPDVLLRCRSPGGILKIPKQKK